MTIKGSGALTVTEINTELARQATANFNIGDTQERALTKILSGTITWSDFYNKTREIVAAVGTDYNQQSIQNFYSADDWAGPATKVFVIPRGRTMYSSVSGTAGLRTGTGRGGLLRIENDGNILGGPGAPNSGVGGDALLIQQTGVTLHNTYQVFAGGGAGGVGGQGGSGYFQTSYVVYETGGEWTQGYSRTGSEIYTQNGSSYPGVWTYYAWQNGGIHSGWYGAWYYTTITTYSGQQDFGREEPYYLPVSGGNYQRHQTRYTDNYSSGGPGGTGGWGTGWSGGGSTAGVGGGAGGTNAGTGGVGGNGGGWGASGGNGATGNTGNYTGGAGGGGGGLSGFAVNLNGFTITNTSTGDRRGR